MSVHVKVVHRPESFEQELVLPAVISGLGITMRHFFQNLFGKKKEIVTFQYPEEKQRYPERYRGLHRLMKREDGEVRCVACGLCVEACPCDAIRMDTGVHMPPTEHRHLAVLGKNDLLAQRAVRV